MYTQHRLLVLSAVSDERCIILALPFLIEFDANLSRRPDIWTILPLGVKGERQYLGTLQGRLGRALQVHFRSSTAAIRQSGPLAAPRTTRGKCMSDTRACRTP